jgi:hypothetical protein
VNDSFILLYVIVCTVDCAEELNALLSWADKQYSDLNIVPVLDRTSLTAHVSNLFEQSLSYARVKEDDEELRHKLKNREGLYVTIQYILQEIYSIIFVLL